MSPQKNHKINSTFDMVLHFFTFIFKKTFRTKQKRELDLVWHPPFSEISSCTHIPQIKKKNKLQLHKCINIEFLLFFELWDRFLCSVFAWILIINLVSAVKSVLCSFKEAFWIWMDMNEMRFVEWMVVSDGRWKWNVLFECHFEKGFLWESFFLHCLCNIGLCNSTGKWNFCMLHGNQSVKISKRHLKIKNFSPSFLPAQKISLIHSMLSMVLFEIGKYSAQPFSTCDWLLVSV